MKRVVAVCWLFAMLLCLCGCQRDVPHSKTGTQTDAGSSSPYLSITVSAYNDGATEESGVVTTVYSLDLESNKVEKVWAFENTSQYPLATYSRHDNSVYYTQKVENGKTGKGDQLFAKNLSTGEILQMSEELFGVNYIVPFLFCRSTFLTLGRNGT